MTKYGTARAFQTATAERLGTCAKTLDWADDRGAAYVELPWNPADAGCTTKVLQRAARQPRAVGPSSPLLVAGPPTASLASPRDHEAWGAPDRNRGRPRVLRRRRLVRALRSAA